MTFEISYVLADLSDACGSDPNLLCEWVFESTENEALATVADWFVDRPLRILGILVAALLISRILRRAVTRFSDKLALRHREPPEPDDDELLGSLRMRVSRLTQLDQQRERAAQRAVTLGAVGAVLAAIVGVIGLLGPGLSALRRASTRDLVTVAMFASLLFVVGTAGLAAVQHVAVRVPDRQVEVVAPEIAQGNGELRVLRGHEDEVIRVVVGIDLAVHHAACVDRFRSGRNVGIIAITIAIAAAASNQHRSSQHPRQQGCYRS